MDITYLGAGSVKLSGRQINILYEPYDETAGLGKLKTSAEVTLVSSPDSKAETIGMRVEGPGEYEVKGALIIGVPARLHIDAEGQRGTIYSVSIDGINVVCLGNMMPDLSDSQVEQLGQVDVLVVPVGGHGLTLDATGAAQIVSRLEPKYVIPTHYDDGKTKYPMPQEKVDKFLSEVGSSPEPISKLKLNAKEMPLETEVVVLERSGS